MVKYEKLIFVCTGNTCRSPMAEAIYRTISSEHKLPVISRGLVVLFPEPINTKADVILINERIPFSEHSSKQLDQADIDENTLILTMTEQQKLKVQREYKNYGDVFTIREFVSEEGDVKDPYGGSFIDYMECYEEIKELIKKLINKFEM